MSAQQGESKLVEEYRRLLGVERVAIERDEKEGLTSRHEDVTSDEQETESERFVRIWNNPAAWRNIR